MLVLGIESTCDETACSIVENGEVILSNVIISQSVHESFGGVYPELASRQHYEAILPVVQKCLQHAGISLKEIDLIAVAKGPGLVGSLLIGLHTAKHLAYGLGIPFIGVNHVEAHLYAAMMGKRDLLFPALGIVASGGHTLLVEIRALGDYHLLGTTVDDAVGEAFDKVAAMLKLSYPGGPVIEKFARMGKKDAFSWQAGKVKGRPFDLSFSGLKTAVLYTIKELTGNFSRELTEVEKRDIAASFQETALRGIVERAALCAKKMGLTTIFIGGGVSCNQRFKELFQELCPTLQLSYPEQKLCVDNGAMIAGLGYHIFLKRGSDDFSMEVRPRIPFYSSEGVISSSL